jgi:hypothetical protein
MHFTTTAGAPSQRELDRAADRRYTSPSAYNKRVTYTGLVLLDLGDSLSRLLAKRLLEGAAYVTWETVSEMVKIFAIFYRGNEYRILVHKNHVNELIKNALDKVNRPPDLAQTAEMLFDAIPGLREDMANNCKTCNKDCPVRQAPNQDLN